MSIYTQKVTEHLIDLWVNQGMPIEDIALELGTKKRGVIAKLCSLGLYKRQQYISKSGEVPIKKAEYLERLAILLGVEMYQIESLEKASKGTLKILVEALDPL